TSTEALQQVAPLATESLSRLRKVMDGVKVPPEQMLRITCLSSALGDYPAIHAEAARQFPNAVITVVQLLRGLSSGLVECEGMARLSAPPSAPLELVNPEGMPSSPNYSLVALVNAPKVVITSTQLAFHNSEADIRLAFE